MVEVKELNLTEILTALQDFMTSDGSISGEQREFYSVFRQHLNGHVGEFKVEDIENLLISAKHDVPNLPEEEFIKMGEAILNRYRNKNEDALNELNEEVEDSAANTPFVEERRDVDLAAKTPARALPRV